jgi:hypothetical protein
MTPVKINQHSHKFIRPDNWDEEAHGPCGDLYVRVEEGVCESAWRPSRAELKALQEGHAVILRVYGRQPPVALYVEPATDP